jgi:hypothetical protein
MNQRTLEERVSALEQILAELMRHGQAAGPLDWRSTIGMFGDDPVMREIQDEGRKIREADRQAARQKAEEDW